jgi:hypothetical protein
LVRLALASAFAIAVSLPVHWESLRYPAYVSFNNTVYDPARPLTGRSSARTIYYNVEILVFPHRWFNDYRSAANVWLPALNRAGVPRRPDASRFLRGGHGADAAPAALQYIRSGRDVRSHPARAADSFALRRSPGSCFASPARDGWRWPCRRRSPCTWPRRFVPVGTFPICALFDPPLIDRIAAADGNLVLVEISPHRDMDSDPNRRSPRTPFAAHWEGLLPDVAGQRFYSQMWDGWVWNIFKRHIVGAGTFAGHAIERTPPEAFAAEMRDWASGTCSCGPTPCADYLAGSGLFAERWRGGRWSQFEVNGVDTRSVVTATGTGRLRNLDFLGGEVELTGITAGAPVRVRANYYPAWRARLGGSRRAAPFRRRTDRVRRAGQRQLRREAGVSPLPLAVDRGESPPRSSARGC